MSDSLARFGELGFLVSGALFSRQSIDSIVRHLPMVESSGTRALLDSPKFVQLAERLRSDPVLAPVLEDLVAVEGIFFQKCLDRNWSVSPHRDSIVPIHGDGPWKAAGPKEGMAFAHAPVDFMRRCVAVRLALDDVPEGDIRVEPGTHLTMGSSSSLTLVVPKGGVVVMRPSLVHSSAKLRHSRERRVIHLLYAPREIPKHYRWYHAA